MKLLVFLGACLIGLPVFAQPVPSPFRITFDHADGVYRVGEKVIYTVSLQPESGLAPDAEIFWRLSMDNVEPIKTGSVKLENGSMTLTGSLDQPGFLQLKVHSNVAGKETFAQEGVGFEPVRIAPSLPVPDDFDSFWKSQLAKLVEVPINPKLTLLTEPVKKGVVTHDVLLDCVGAPVSGYFSKPEGAEPKSLPAILMLHGAGVRSANAVGTMGWAGNGLLAMDINAHGISNGKDEAYYKEQTEGALKDYRFRDRDSREKIYFAGMFLRAKRALDFLCSQPEWDGKTLVVYGSSQGGYQAFAAAALDDRVTMMAALVPAGCDHTGMLANRTSGWPKIIPVVNGKPDAAVVEASRYIDAVNFATRVKAKEAIVTTGFIDEVCPPTSVYAAFNALPVTNKKIINDLGKAHAPSAATEKEVIAAVRKHMGRP